MSDYVPEVGHRVRVTETYEGIVRRVGNAGGLDVDGAPHGFRIDSPAVMVERLPDPEPTWQRGDVVRDAEGRTLCFWGASGLSALWQDLARSNAAPLFVGDTEVPRPLTLLVRDGQAVEQ